MASPNLTQTHNPDGSNTYRIDRPDVSRPTTAYPGVVLHKGDVVRISAGGCVQTGGSGKTWKRFVAPTGKDAERLYSGTIAFGGARPSPSGRLANWIGVPIAIVVDGATVSVGYQDDSYGDNGYANPDPGTDGQCLGQPPAWIAFNVGRGPPALTGDPRYDEVAGKGAHNAYDRLESFPDMLGFHHLRSLEIDIQDSNEHDHWPELTRDWYVYHHVAHIGGIAGDTGSSCRKLTDCLQLLRAYHRAVPQHEVITIVIDGKDPFRAQQQQSPADFESVMLAGLGAQPGDVFTPAALASSCRSGGASAAGQACPWPRLSQLRGKWLVVLTGDGPILPDYLNCGSGDAVACARRRLGFVAPSISSEAEIGQHPEARVFNLDASTSSPLALGGPLRLKGMIARAYGLSSPQGWSAAFANGVELLATDEINASPPTPLKTANAHGWPFTCLREDCSSRAADQPTLGVRVASGDIGGHADDFMFLETRGPVQQVSGFAFAPSSYVDDQAKACFMARAAISRTAPYFAVCRAARTHAPAIQYRLNDGGDTERVEIPREAFLPGGDVSAASITAIRLVPSGGGRCYGGEASIDGVDWRPIGKTICLPGPLAHTGVAASSHGSGAAVSFDLADVRLDGAPASAAAFLPPARVGSVQEAVVANQPF